MMKDLEKLAAELAKELGNTPEVLWAQWNKTKDKEDLSRVVHQFDPLINKTLQQYRDNPIDDSIIQGEIQRLTIEGIKKYDPSKGTKLITAIFPWLQKTSRFVQQNSNVIRIPEHKVMEITTFKNAKMDLENKLGREPTNVEVADDLSWNIKNVERMEKMLSKSIPSNFFDIGRLAVQNPQENLDRDMIHYFYYDLPSEQQLIFESSTGYLGKPLLTIPQMSQKFKKTPYEIKKTKEEIAGKLKEIILE